MLLSRVTTLPRAPAGAPGGPALRRAVSDGRRAGAPLRLADDAAGDTACAGRVARRRDWRRHLPLACAVLLWAPLVAAADVRSVEVTRDGDSYAVVSDLYFAAPIDAVYGVLADYDGFERVSSIFKDSRYLERKDNGDGLVFTLLGDCILFFCRDIERTETLQLDPPTQIRTWVVPEQSDLRSGWSRWTLQSEGEGTQVLYEMQMEPDFWIPPVIGPFFIKRFLKSGSDRAAQRVEYFARKDAGLEAELDGVELVPGHE